MKKTKTLRKGDRVRDTKWGGKYTGTVVRAKTDASGKHWAFVQWDSIAIEDQMLDTEVEALGTRIQGDIPTVVKAVEIGRRP